VHDTCSLYGESAPVLQDVVVGKPRDGDDRVAWLLDHQRFDAALSVLETDKGLKKSTHAQVMASFLPAFSMARQVFCNPRAELAAPHGMHASFLAVARYWC